MSPNNITVDLEESNIRAIRKGKGQQEGEIPEQAS